MSTSRSQHKVRLALRLNKATGCFEWAAVRGLRLALDGKKVASDRKRQPGGFELFTYRDRRVVFVVDDQTGIPVAFGASVEQARTNLIAILDSYLRADIRGQLDQLFREINPGPKPTIKLKL